MPEVFASLYSLCTAVTGEFPMLQPALDPRAPQRKTAQSKRRTPLRKPRLAEGPQPTRAAGYEQKKSLPAVMGSLLAIGIILFALGKIPSIDAFGSSLNTTLQSHNDLIVTALMHSLPAICMAFGALLVVGLLWAQRTTRHG
jgi:hypothetical protein